MKCLFYKDIICCHPDTNHDVCRHCEHVPDMDRVHSVTEMRLLRAISGKRDDYPDRYGSISSDEPEWIEDLLKKRIFNIPCMDHRRYLDNMLISEPYDVHMGEMRELIEFCDEHGLTFTIDGDSAHFPGRCFRILIVKKSGV